MVDTISTRTRRLCQRLVPIVVGMMLFLATDAASVNAQTTPVPAVGLPANGAAVVPAKSEAPQSEAPQREIFVPFDDLHIILSSDVQRVFVTREEYEALAAKAKLASKPEGSVQPAAVLSADYVATLDENQARFLGTLIVMAPDEALHAVQLDLSGVALRTATLDNKPAALGRDSAGIPILFVSGAGRHELKLEILAPVDTAVAQRTLAFQIPTPPATRLKLTVPGNVEIKSAPRSFVARSIRDRRRCSICSRDAVEIVWCCRSTTTS